MAIMKFAEKFKVPPRTTSLQDLEDPTQLDLAMDKLSDSDSPTLESVALFMVKEPSNHSAVKPSKT